MPGNNEPDEISIPTTATGGNATFRQLIDHNNPELGTFSQYYVWSNEFYVPGGPVILFTPGETDAIAGYKSYLHENRTTGRLAKEVGGAVVLIEHRYYGRSSPYADLTTDNMKYMTLDNAISDLTYFAQNVRLPFDPDGKSSPDRAPWIMMGGSYSGALSAYTASTQPGTYWAYWASSAPVQVIVDYWQYFVPIQKGMAKNCSTDVSLVVDYMDSVILNGTESEIKSLKTMFGLQDLEHNDDFLSALQNGPWSWQSLDFYSDDQTFFEFCDAVENVFTNTSALPGAEGVGVEKALAGYAHWFTNNYLPGRCASYGYADWADNYSIACFDSYNASSPYFTDTSLANTIGRQWTWMICNQPMGFFQGGAPANRPSIVSHLLRPEYWIRQCPLMFPPTDTTQVGITRGATEEQVNAHTKGWFNYSPRLLYVNGEFDPWREASVSSEFRPGGPLQSSAKNPVIVVPGGFHTSDLLIGPSGDANAGVKAAIEEGLCIMREWVAEFKPGKQ